VPGARSSHPSSLGCAPSEPHSVRWRQAGGRENFFHCGACNTCLPIETQSTHRCAKMDAYGETCPVCNIGYSVPLLHATALSCGHFAHAECQPEVVAAGKCAACAEKPDQAHSAVGQYRCVKKSQIRSGFEMDSAKAGVMAVGTELEALELRVNDKGVTRVRFSGGWLSEKTGAGALCLQAQAPPA